MWSVLHESLVSSLSLELWLDVHDMGIRFHSTYTEALFVYTLEGVLNLSVHRKS